MKTYLVRACGPIVGLGGLWLAGRLMRWIFQNDGLRGETAFTLIMLALGIGFYSIGAFVHLIHYEEGK